MANSLAMENLYIVLICLLILALIFILTRRAVTDKNQNSAHEELKSDNGRLLVELAKLQERCRGLEQEKHTLSSRFLAEKEELARQLAFERDQNSMLTSDYIRAKSNLDAQKEKLEEQKSELEAIRRSFNKDFELIANKILEEKTSRFTETNKNSLDALLNPLKENIKSFQEKVEKVYDSESADRNILKGEINKLMELNKQISEEASNLTRALKTDSKKQGNWGEIVLDRILEASGLLLNESYTKQTSFTGQEGNRLQPDVLIHLPGSKHMVVDSKVSLVAYERLVNCQEDDERCKHMSAHINSIKEHIKSLSSKNYSSLYGIDSPEFVLLFVPIESSFAIAVQQDAELFDFAWSRRVVLVTPSTLLATLKTIASIWKQEKQTRNAIEIASKAGALYDKFVGFMDDLAKIGQQLDKAKESYSGALNKLSTGTGNIVSRIEGLRILGAKTSKQLDSRYISGED